MQGAWLTTADKHIISLREIDRVRLRERGEERRGLCVCSPHWSQHRPLSGSRGSIFSQSSGGGAHSTRAQSTVRKASKQVHVHVCIYYDTTPSTYTCMQCTSTYICICTCTLVSDLLTSVKPLGIAAATVVRLTESSLHCRALGPVTRVDKAVHWS